MRLYERYHSRSVVAVVIGRDAGGDGDDERGNAPGDERRDDEQTGAVRHGHLDERHVQTVCLETHPRDGRQQEVVQQHRHAPAANHAAAPLRASDEYGQQQHERHAQAH